MQVSEANQPIRSIEFRAFDTLLHRHSILLLATVIVPHTRASKDVARTHNRRHPQGRDQEVLERPQLHR